MALHRAEIAVTVRGSVAHVCGRASGVDERDLIRRVITRVLYVMNEIHRVLKPDGVLHVMVPHWQCVNAVADPTHLRSFHRQTFKFFCRPYPHLRSFRPMSVSETSVDLFADLQPIKNGRANTDQALARFFD